MRRPRHEEDAGASLILVLIFMLFVSVLALGALSYSEVSLYAHGAVRDVREENYSADAALELGIHEVVRDTSGLLGTPGVGCPPLTLLGGVGVPAAVVTCEAKGTAGAPIGSRALNAILTLSSSATSLELRGNSSLGVNGNTYVHGGIKTGQPFNTLDVTGTVHALAGNECATNKVTATAGKVCSGAATAQGDDPAWPSLAGTAFDLGGMALTNPPPACTGTSHKLATFAPGRYTSSPTALLTGDDCKKRQTLYFAPGVYYFHNVTFNTGEYDVVAGSASTWLAAASAPPRDGSACLEQAAGVQWLLGGTSNVVVPNQTTAVAICAGPALSSSPAVALYGVRSSGNGLTQHSAATGLSTANRPSVFVYGSIYTPTAKADITLHNRTQTYFKGGFVVSSLVADVSASSKQIDSPISVPACTEADPCRTNREVIFTASVDGDPWIRSVVSFDDAGGSDPARSHSVDTWSVLR